MRPANFLLFLMPLAGCDLAGGDPAGDWQCGFFDPDYPSTGVDPTELLGLLSRLTLISRERRLETLSADAQTASDTLNTLQKILGGISFQSSALVSYVPRLEDTAPFECFSDKFALTTIFAKWQTTTGAWLVAIYKVSGSFGQGGSYQASRLASELEGLKNATAKFSWAFRTVMSGTDLAPRDVGPAITMAAAALDSIFQDTIYQLRKTTPLGG